MWKQFVKVEFQARFDLDMNQLEDEMYKLILTPVVDKSPLVL